MDNKNNDKFEMLSLETELLKTCSTNQAFFQRIVIRTLPLLRQLFEGQILTWENELLNDSRVIEANTELTEAFFSLWEIAKRNKNQSLKKELIKLLRIVRGPCFEFLNSLLSRIYPKLKSLYLTYASIPKKYPLAIRSNKIVLFEQVWRRQYQNWKLFLYEPQVKINWDLKPSKSCITANFKKSSLSNFQFKILAMEKQIIEKEKKFILRKFSTWPQSEEIDYEMGRIFAPKATELYLYTSDKFDCDLQTDPKLIWLNLKTLDECWDYRKINILSVRWPRLRGTRKDIGLIAYSTYSKCSLIVVAEELKNLDNPKKNFQFFDRDKYTALLQRLYMEIRMKILFPNNEASKQKVKNLMPPILGSDEDNFCLWYETWLKKNKTKSAHTRTKVDTIKDFDKSTVKLNKRYKPSTYETWIRNFNNRKKALNGKTTMPLR